MGGSTATVSISVVMPTYNRCDHLEESARRVLEQLGPQDELVIVDDGSVDRTHAVLASIDDHRLRTIRRPNGGISAARNSGVAVATGDYVVPVDDDDIPLAGWLDGLRSAVRNGSVSFASCGYEIVDAASGDVVSIHLPEQLGALFSDYVGCYLAGTFAVRRDVYLELGGFTEGLQCSHQTEFVMRVLDACRRNGGSVAHVDAILLQVVRRRAGDRPESSPEKLLSGTAWILEHRSDLLARDRSTWAIYLAIAGVNSYKVGERARARRYLRAAVRRNPRSARHWVRCAISLVPPVAHRAWCRETGERN